MRKNTIDLTGADTGASFSTGWLDLTEIATAEVSSEDPRFPVESAFTPGGDGWRALQPGKQIIRIIFDEPTSLSLIRLRFEETEAERTQEFSLKWQPWTGDSREIVRQQWNFSPTGSTSEIEEYAVTLTHVKALELAIQPDANRKDAIASLAEWRVKNAG